MTTDIAPLASPIDALCLIHNALRTEAERAEQTVEHLEVGSSFKAFQPAFYHWALVLSTYVEAEERALTALVPEVAHVWETTADTARQLLERLEALQTYIQTELGKTIVIARTKRQLFGRVALARLLQEDYSKTRKRVSYRSCGHNSARHASGIFPPPAPHRPGRCAAGHHGRVDCPGRDGPTAPGPGDSYDTPRKCRQRSLAPLCVCTLICARQCSLFMSARRQLMTMDITYCDSPIDIMYLIHHALRAEAAEVTQRARQLCTADTLAALAQAVHQWASTLEEHARIEDTYMTPLLPARPAVQDIEVEHQRLTALFRELASFLQAITPQTPLMLRLQRQVLGHVITLGVEHDDHLESEEDLVLPLVRQRLSRGPAMRAGLAPVMRWGEPGGGDDRPLGHGRVDDRRAAGTGHAS